MYNSYPINNIFDRCRFLYGKVNLCGYTKVYKLNSLGTQAVEQHSVHKEFRSLDVFGKNTRFKTNLANFPVSKIFQHQINNWN